MKYVKKVIHFCKMIPVGLLLVLTILSAGLSILEVSTDILKRVPQGAIYGIYIMAAISLSLTICRLIGLFRNPEWKSKLWEALHRWKLLGKLVDDFSYRTIVATRLSFVINMIFAISKGAAGWLSASAWLITLAVYYMLLSMAKVLLLGTNRKVHRIEDQGIEQLQEWKSYLNCGIIFIVLTIVLQGMVVLIMKTGQRFPYHEILILAIAAFDFYNLTIAIIYMVRHRGAHSPIIVAIKRINFASSLVSILSLQTAMFAVYGEESGKQMQSTMNLLTGSAVSIILLGLGIVMVRKAQKEIKIIKKENE